MRYLFDWGDDIFGNTYAEFQLFFCDAGGASKRRPAPRRGDQSVDEDTPNSEIFTPSRSGNLFPRDQVRAQSPVQSGAVARTSPTQHMTFNFSFEISGFGGDQESLKEELRRTMRYEVRESFRGVLGDVGMRFS